MRATLPTNGEVLQRVSLFAGLTDDDRDALAARLRRRRYARGETLSSAATPVASCT
jgi:hypothetical protein